MRGTSKFDESADRNFCAVFPYDNNDGGRLRTELLRTHPRNSELQAQSLPSKLGNDLSLGRVLSAPIPWRLQAWFRDMAQNSVL